MLKTGHTEKKVVHRVDYNLFDHIKVGEVRELAVVGCMLLDEVLVSGGCTELTILIAESTMLLACPPTERCNTQADK